MPSGEVPTVTSVEFPYVYGAVSPLEGGMEWMLCKEMNTERMSEFLAQISARYL